MRRALLLAAGGVLSASLTGVAVADVVPPDDSDQRALRLLAAAAQAGRESSYEGTQVVMLWLGDRQLSASVRIAHRAGAGSLIQVESTANTRGRTVFEPTGRGSGAMSGPTAEALDLVRRNYVVALDGSDDVLGRPVDIVLVRTRAGRPVQRLWIDRSSALPLRRTFYDDSGRLVRQTAFVALSERVPTFATVQTATIPVVSATRGVDAAALRADGWVVPATPDGMVAYDASLRGSGASAVLHLTYTDGIATMSLFAQRGRLDRSAVRGWQRARLGGTTFWIGGGHPRRAVWSADGHVYTVVTDCDEPTLQRMIRSLPGGESPDTFTTRVGRGARRFVSWVNPAR